MVQLDDKFPLDLEQDTLTVEVIERDIANADADLREPHILRSMCCPIAQAVRRVYREWGYLPIARVVTVGPNLADHSATSVFFEDTKGDISIYALDDAGKSLVDSYDNNGCCDPATITMTKVKE